MCFGILSLEDEHEDERGKGSSVKKDMEPFPYRRYRPSLVNQQFWSDRFVLFVEGITAVFDGFKALDIDAFGIEHGEIRVIIGPNGAGKTTFVDVVTGKTQPTTGQVYFDGEEITPLLETEIASRGVGRKFQTPTVFDSLTTFENMELALPGRKRAYADLLAKVSLEERERIDSTLERVNLLDVRDQEAKYLSHGQRQWLAISALMISDPKLLLVDEPAAGLTDSETSLTADLLKELSENHTIVVVEHDMDFVRQLESRVTVLNEGKIMAEGSLDEIKKNDDVIEAYLGR